MEGKNSINQARKGEKVMGNKDLPWSEQFKEREVNR